MSLRIFLADLTHTGLGVATEAFPLNIGLVAAYAQKRFGREVEFALFKYPEELRDALRRAPPDVLGCSNYTWNSHLAYHFLEMAKAVKPDTLTVFGGTNYPFDAENQRLFLERKPRLDLHIFYEAEEAFSLLIERILSSPGRRDWLSEPIPGCQFLHPQSRTLCAGTAPERIKDLDSIPSPYTTGLLDRFFDGKLTPLLETARGCPFTCNFCNAGATYFTRVNQFSDAYVREEWEYVARWASAAGIGHMTLADNNFGMLPRDTQTAELMHELQGRYGWPRSVTAWTGKNSKKRVIDVTRLLGDTLVISMAVQSMDERVLKNIARSNIRLEDYRAIAQELNAQGRPQVGELIAPLPGDTWDSYLRGVHHLLDAGVSTVLVHTLQMLHGTPYRDEPGFIAEHGFLRKHRLVPLDFGTYDGRKVFDTEEVGVATKTFSLEEYVESRKYLLLVDLCYNGTVCEPLKRYLLQREVRMSEWIHFLYQRIPQLPPPVWAVFDSFGAETLTELWDSEEGLVAFYSRPENYRKLLQGEIGGNVLFKHKTRMLAERSRDWIDTVFSLSQELLDARAVSAPSIGIGHWVPREELEELRRYTFYCLADAFHLGAVEKTLTGEFCYDIPRWMKSPGAPLASFQKPTPLRIRFEFSEEQMLLRAEAQRRYGAHLAGIVKWIQRLAGTQRLMRQPTPVPGTVPEQYPVPI